MKSASYELKIGTKQLLDLLFIVNFRKTNGKYPCQLAALEEEVKHKYTLNKVYGKKRER